MSPVADFAEAFLQIHLTNSLDSSSRFDIGILSLDDAYEVQRRVLSARVARGEQVVGYKVGCTNRAVRGQFGISEPICGRLLAPHVYYGDTELDWHDYVHCAVEPEFVMRLGQDIAAEVPPDQDLRAALEWVAPGIEVHHNRFWFGKPTLQELIASNGIHAGLVVGPARVPLQELNLAAEGVGIFRNDELAASGIGAEIGGGPLHSLRWLAHHLLRRGEHLKAGQIVISGSPVALVPVDPNDRITASFTRLGSVSATFVG